MYDIETGETRLHPAAESVELGTVHERYDQYVYDLMIESRDLSNDDPRFANMLAWIDQRLRRRLRHAAQFDPEGGVFPTHAEAIVVLEPLLNTPRGIWPFRRRSVMSRLTEIANRPPEDLPAVRAPIHERYPELGFVGVVRGIELLPNLPFEYCSGNILKVTKRDPEATVAHEWLYAHNSEYRQKFDAVVAQFIDDHHPDQIPPQDAPRLKLLTERLQRCLRQAGIDAYIRAYREQQQHAPKAGRVSDESQ